MFFFEGGVNKIEFGEHITVSWIHESRARQLEYGNDARIFLYLIIFMSRPFTMFPQLSLPLHRLRCSAELSGIQGTAMNASCWRNCARWSKTFGPMTESARICQAPIKNRWKIRLTLGFFKKDSWPILSWKYIENLGYPYLLSLWNIDKECGKPWLP